MEDGVKVVFEDRYLSHTKWIDAKCLTADRYTLTPDNSYSYLLIRGGSTQ
jgi:hypothetical protein